MARSSQPQNKRRNTSSDAMRSGEKRRLSSSAQEPAGFLDEETKRNILGVSVILLAIVIFVASVFPSKAVVTSFIYDALHLTFGIGCYVFPVFLAAIGISFMIHSEREHVSSRASLGLFFIFLAILSILSLFTPGASEGSTDLMFAKENVTSLGGYVGAVIAWAGVTLLGQTISLIVMAGIIVLSVFVIGFSLNEFKTKIEEKRQARARKRQDDVLPAPSFKPGRSGNTGGYTRPLAPSGALPSPDYKNPTKSSSIKPATSLVGKSSLFEKKKKEGWVDPTLAEFQDSKQDGASPSSNTVLLGDGKKRSSAVTTVLSGDDVVSATTQRKSATKGNASEAKPLTRKLGKKKDEETPGKAPKTRVKKERVKPDESLAIPAPMEGFELPPQDYLRRSETKITSNASEDELRETAEILAETLEDFGISIEVKGWVAGPTVTLFKIALPSGVRVSRITALNDDIALALAAQGVRIFAPIPGTNYVGIEVPNKTRQNVLLADVLDSAPAGPLQCAVGKDVEGNNVVMNLAKAPHVLIAGTTGSGKSVGINSFIMSMLMRNTPNEVRFILIDPKRVEFSLYNGIPHLYIPVVEDPKDASAALNWGVAEMERRLKLFSSVGARNIAQFNTKVQSGELENENALPFIVIVIDELADLMMNVGKEVEFSISRLAQLARAAGIHLIVATQRPSANVVTGLIKSNITTRIAFTVASGIDSRVILDSPGAENLTGNGDLLFSKPDLAKPLRVQGCFVSEDEINDVVEHLKEQGDPDYHSEILQVNVMSMGDTAPDGSGGRGGCEDPLLWEAAEIVVSAGTASTSYIQRRLSVGYSRAGRIMDMLEQKGVVGPANGSKARDVLVDTMELETLKAFEQEN